MMLIAASATGLALLALTMTIVNRLTWTRGDATSHFDETTSILIPARNEAKNIESCVIAAFSGSLHPDEVIVVDDGSTDATPEILARLAARYPKLRIEHGSGLPPGWIGKPHACHQLASHARGGILIFVDADTRLHEEGLARVASLFRRLRADVVTAFPHQELGSAFERLVLPLLHVTYVAWFPLALVHASRDPRFLAANGQVLAIRREALDEVGGFEAVRDEVVDDMALCRAAKMSGRRVVFADGARIARCRMYQDARGVWEGFSKNLYEGIGERPLALLVVCGLYASAFIAPYVLTLVGLMLTAPWTPIAAAGVAANILLRAILAHRYAQPWWGIVAHPFAVIVFLAIATNSYLWSRRGTIRWSGRTYVARSQRRGAT